MKMDSRKTGKELEKYSSFINSGLFKIAAFFAIFTTTSLLIYSNYSEQDNELFVAAFTPGVSDKATHSKYLELGGLNVNGKWAGLRVVAVSDLEWNENSILNSVTFFLNPNPAPIPKKIKDKLSEICGIQQWNSSEQDGLLEFKGESNLYKCSYQHFYNAAMYQVIISRKSIQ